MRMLRTTRDRQRVSTMLKSRTDELGETDELGLHSGSGNGRMFFKSIEFALAKVCEMKGENSLRI